MSVKPVILTCSDAWNLNINEVTYNVDFYPPGNKTLRTTKTEERKRDTAPRDRFDVHAVMTKAFDMRRKAMEDSEDEEEEDNDEEDWA